MSSSETNPPNEQSGNASPGGDEPRDEWLEANGVTLHCRDWGGDGPPALLLHGLASTCRIWDLTAPLLARRFAVLAIDQRGHGQSGKPDGGYDFATVGQDAAAVLQAKGIQRPLLVGHSWGADVALELAAVQPGLARGLCFIDGGMIEPAARYASLDEARRQMAPPDFSGVTAAQLLEQAGGREPWATLGDRAGEFLLANFREEPDGTLRAHLSRANHLRIIDALWEHHPPQLYPAVSCPALLLPARWRGVPALAERQVARADAVARAGELLPRSAAVWLEDSVHDVPLQRPQLVAETIIRHWDNGFFD